MNKAGIDFVAIIGTLDMDISNIRNSGDDRRLGGTETVVPNSASSSTGNESDCTTMRRLSDAIVGHLKVNEHWPDSGRDGALSK